LDKNVEVGVRLRGEAVASLITWFDDLWDSEQAQPITKAMINQWIEETTAVRKDFLRLRSRVPPEKSPHQEHQGPSIQIPSTAQFFSCNTDRKHGLEAEKAMRETGFAAVWEDFDYVKHFQRVKRGDIIF